MQKFSQEIRDSHSKSSKKTLESLLTFSVVLTADGNGRRGKIHCHCLVCTTTYKLNHMGLAETLEIRLLGPKVATGNEAEAKKLEGRFQVSLVSADVHWYLLGFSSL